MMVTPFADTAAVPHIRGFLHEPANRSGNCLVLTHGAGANCQTKLLVEVADAFADFGFTVLRFDLPFRNERRFGPPRPGNAEKDREGLRRAVALMEKRQMGKIYLGGHSYGGRQSSMLVSEAPEFVDGLLLLSYPLHPPNKPEQLRTAHLPKLDKPAFFVHGTKDPFGTIAEMNVALKLISAPRALLEVDGAGHDLLTKKVPGDLPARVVKEFSGFLAKTAR